jgi:hypothetical protein
MGGSYSVGVSRSWRSKSASGGRVKLSAGADAVRCLHFSSKIFGLWPCMDSETREEVLRSFEVALAQEGGWLARAATLPHRDRPAREVRLCKSPLAEVGRMIDVSDKSGLFWLPAER